MTTSPERQRWVNAVPPSLALRAGDESRSRKVGFLISCTGCKHKLTLPEGFIGQQVQCPNCALEFAAYPSAAPAMEVEPSAPLILPTEAKPANEKPPVASKADPPPQTAYAPRDRVPAQAASPALYCIMCGARMAPSEEACPNCGCPIQTSHEDEFRHRRRPRWRHMEPVRGLFAIVPAILIPVGIVFLIGTPIAAEVFRRNPVPSIFLFLAGSITELTALVFCVLWLYQAWRAVSNEDEEISPGLRVGLLFVPFFNFYWMFCVVPGLSKAIHRELRYVAPARASSAGWVPGLIACIFALIPYGQPVAICVFLAWMLITNNSLQRLIRLNEKLLDEEDQPV